MTTLANISEINKLQTILKYTFGLVPIVAGADKFTNILTNWEAYISPSLANIVPIDGTIFMIIVGVIKIAAGILVLTKTKLGATIVSAWLLLIALSLLFTWHHVDIAVRDIVMAISAFVLAKLSESTTLTARN